MEREQAVGARRDRGLVGVLDRGVDERERVAVVVGERAEHVAGVARALLHVDLFGGVGLARRAVLRAGHIERDRALRGLVAAVADFVRERHGAGAGMACVELQVAAVVDRRDGDRAVLRRADRGDAQHRAIRLLVVAQHVEDLVRAGAHAERVVHGLDLPGLRGARLFEGVLVARAVVVAALGLVLLRLDRLPLDLDDVG